MSALFHRQRAYRAIARVYALALTSSCLFGCASCNKGGKKRADGEETVLPPGKGGPSPFGPGGPDAESAEFGLEERPTNRTCVAPEKPQLDSSIALERVFSKLTLDRPLGLYQAPRDTGHYYAIEQTGRVKRFANDPNVESAETVLELKVAYGSGDDERGLLGLAFHPRFPDEPYAFVNYIRASDSNTVIARYRVDPQSGAFSSPKVLLEVDQPYYNHNGGHLAFGPDGFLYIGLGDGGAAGDPENRAQNPNQLLGKMLRIDVDSGDPYGIPPGNMFENGGGRREIYALGLRNPWRYSFDRETGELWAGDVGQGCFEEIDIIEAGKNYGWRVKEGRSCYDDNRRNDCSVRAGCSDQDMTDPVITYGRDEGASVTGGYVYRGRAIPGLVGHYLYGDFASGRIWAAEKVGSSYRAQLLLQSELAVASFAEDSAGELYVVHRGRGANEGALYRVVGAESQATNTLPQKLSQTGCVNPRDPREPSAGLIPFMPRVPFWSDGGEKERWLALPEGTRIRVLDDGDWELPPGAVTMKTFWVEGRRVETRFYVRWADGSYGGYTYQWNADETDAELVSGHRTVRVGNTNWYIPSRGECDVCHDPISHGHLGLENIQLDHDLSYATKLRANQIATLAHIGLFERAPERPIAALPRVDDESRSLDERARAYLHGNCAYCHRPSGPGRGTFDLRFATSDLGVCNVEPREGDLGVAGARLLVPGEPERSLLYVRASTRGNGKMPPLASERVDEAGVKLLGQWISSQTSCSE